MKCKKIIFFIVFIVFAFLFSFQVNGNEISQSDEIQVIGAQVRSTGNAGIRFVGSVGEYDTSNIKTYGLILAYGKTEEEIYIDSVVNDKDVLICETDSVDENGYYYVTLYDIPSTQYDVNVSARAYVKDVDGNIIYGASHIARSLDEVVFKAYHNNDRSEFVCSVYKQIEELTEVDLVYDGTVVTKYNGSREIIAIPEGATSIGDSAFINCTYLTKIAIPNGITSIGTGTFYGCTSLTSIEIPSSVTSIGEDAFSGCTSLTNIVVDANNPIYDSRNDCNAIIETSTNTLIVGCKDTKIPSSVTSIGTGTFYGCTSLTSIEIPSSVTSIGSSAFNSCTSLTNIEIPNSVTSIGGYTFSGCSSLTNIEIPSSVESIGIGAFDGCTSLTNIEIPNSVTSIGDFAFSFCTSLTSIEIPNSVTSIGGYTFANCSFLTSIEIPSSVESIGIGAVFGCTSLTSIALPFIGQNADGSGETYFGYIFGTGFDHYTSIPNSLKEVVLLGGTSVKRGEFKDCTDLISIIIPNSVKCIEAYAFEDCKSLQSITIPFVGQNADGSGETHFGYIFGASEYSRNSSFVPSSLKETIITGGASIGESAFFDCASLTNIEIPNSVTSIGGYTFSGCSSLTNIEIPSSVESIGIGAFSSCTSLTNIEIPSSVTSIGEDAFYGCTSLTNIEIPNSVTSIGSSAFRYCTSLTNITIPFVGQNADGSGETYFGYIFGAINYSSNSSSVPSSLKEVIITGGTSIDVSAFRGCSSLTTVKIKNGVTSIGRYAFTNCTSLISVVIPSSVISNGYSAFSGCKSVTFYCEADSEASGWSSYWNPNDCPVIWGYTGN